MTPQEIQERNKQIALMLGYVNTTPADKDFNIFEYPTKFGAIPKMIETMSMKFHSDWNWLMEGCKHLGMEFVNTDILTTFKIVSDEARKRNTEKHS
jgi:hypothetical protein